MRLGLVFVAMAMFWTTTAAAADEVDEEETRVERNVETRKETTTETRRRTRRAPKVADGGWGLPASTTEEAAPPSEPPAPKARIASSPPAEERATEERWYGWQTLIVDGVSVLTAPIGFGVATYALGPPIVHAAHGRWAVAAGDLGLRVGAPIAGVMLGALVCGDRGGEWGCLGEALIGGALGIVAAITIDAAVLANERVERVKPSTSAVRWAPSASPRTGGGFDVGVGGTF